MLRRITTVFSLTILLSPVAGLAQEQDEKPLKDLSRAYVKAWNQKKAADVANLYAADAILTAPTGETVRGRQAIQNGFESELGAGRKISLSAEEYRWLAEDAVVWRYEWKTTGGGASSSGTGLSVLTRSGGAWQIVEDLVALTPVSAAPAQAEPEEQGDHGHDHGSGDHGHDH